MQRPTLISAWLIVLMFSAGCGADGGTGGSALPAGNNDHQGEIVDDHAVLQNPTANLKGALSDGRASRCVESYSPEAVLGRAFAFDGVVVALGSSVSDRRDEGDLDIPGVTFEVRQWFAGGSAETVTVDLPFPGSATSALGAPDSAFGIGSRLLISGEARWGGSPLDHPIAWGCGFSRYYDRETAKSWHDAFAR